MPGEVRCPVCGRPPGPGAAEAAGAEVACDVCGWTLYAPPRAGSVTGDVRRDFETRLQAARHHQAERDARALDTALRNMIEDLHPGSTSAVIDITPDQVTTTTTGLDDAGSPWVSDGDDVSWTRVLPMLPATGEQRRAQLADGIEELADRTITGLVSDRVPPVRADRLLVICRPAGWRVLEAAAEALTARPRARLLRLGETTELSVPRALATLAAKAPLRHPYRLMTAAVDGRTGAVALHPSPLFAAGDEPGTEASLRLRRMPGDVSDVTLAIFADTGGSRGADGVAADPLALYSVSLPPGRAARLRAVLDGPGRVRIIEPAHAIPHPATWAQVRAQVPSQVTTAIAPVDLVCAIDLSGTSSVVRRRKTLVRDLVELLEAEYPEQQRLKVGVVTCTDHIFGRRPGKGERTTVTSVCGLGPAADALGWLDRQARADIKYEPCTPVEDLLNDSLALLSGSRRARRVPLLLVVAGRRPHPHEQLGDDRLPCPHNFMWQDLVDRLTREAGAGTVVVADTLPGTAQGAEWRRIGTAGRRLLSDATARDVAEDLGLLAGQAQRIPLPLTDEPEGAIR